MSVENQEEVSCKNINLVDMNEAYRWPLATISSHVPLVKSPENGYFWNSQFPSVQNRPVPSSPFCRCDWPNSLELSHRSN